jgi:HSP20 family protein
MTIIRRPSPFGELMSLRQAMDRLFEDSYVRPTRSWLSGLTEMLPLDIRNGRDELLIEAALPGVKPENVDITIEQSTLTIHASTSDERREGEEGGDYVLQEIRRGEMVRTVTLPSGLEPDKAAATFEDGILKLRIPRADEVKPRQIRIHASHDGKQAASPVATVSGQPSAGSDAKR